MRSRRRRATSVADHSAQHIAHRTDEISTAPSQQSYLPITTQPALFTQPGILGLQRQIGNYAVTQILRRPKPTPTAQPINSVAKLMPGAPVASTQAAPTAVLGPIQRMKTGNVDKRVTYIKDGLEKSAKFKSLSIPSQGMIHTWSEPIIKNIFTDNVPSGQVDNDNLYSSLITAINELLTVLTNYSDVGGDFGKKDIKDAKKALITAMQGGKDLDTITSATKNLATFTDDIISNRHKNYPERMKKARGKEQEYEKYSAMTDLSTREEKEVEKFKKVIEAAKSKDEGVTQDVIASVDPIIAELEKLAAVTTIANQLKATYMAAPFHLPLSEADKVYKLRHAGGGYKKEATMRTEYKQAVRDWRNTQAGNESTTLNMAETDDILADFHPDFDKHLFKGSITMGKGTGVHFRSALNGLNPTARVVAGTRSEEGSGFWSAKVEVRVGADDWRAKDERSTFFPDAWTRKIVREQITEAWNNKAWIIVDQKWHGTAHGVEYQGYVDNVGRIKAAWPQVIPQPTDLN